MRQYVMGVDASTKGTGWCILDAKTFELVDCGCIRVDTKKEPDPIARTLIMSSEIDKVLGKYKPIHIYQEDACPAIKNSMTVKVLATLKGCLLQLYVIHGIPYKFVLPNVWQSAFGIVKKNGDTKQQSIDWVNNKYNTDFKYYGSNSKKNEDDTTDSICVCCYCLDNYTEIKKLGTRKSKKR